MSFFRKNDGRVQGTFPSRKTYVLFLLFCLQMWGGCSSLSGQTPPIYWTTLNADSFRIGYQLSTSADSLGAGQFFSVKLYSETPSDQGCFGFQFQVKWSNEVELDDSVSHLLNADTWLGSGTVLQGDFEARLDSQDLEWTIWRSDSAEQMGSGLLGELFFQNGALEIASAEWMESFGGGILVEENIDLKRGLQVAERPEKGLFPNPGQDQLFAAVGMRGTLNVYNLQGQLIYKFASPQESWNLFGLKAGIYVAALKCEDGRLIRQKILKR